MKAKTFLIGATLAVIALIGGIYTGVQRSSPQQKTPPSLPGRSIERLFASTLPDTTGKSQAFAQWQGKTLVVNFWATWCPPCREEMPAFSRLQTKHAANSVQFVGIAIDSADMVREFSLQFPATYPLLIGGAEGAELTRQLGNPSLALPYTLIINPAGTATFARLGGLAEHELDTLLQKNTTR